MITQKKNYTFGVHFKCKHFAIILCTTVITNIKRNEIGENREQVREEKMQILIGENKKAQETQYCHSTMTVTIAMGSWNYFHTPLSFENHIKDF